MMYFLKYLSNGNRHVLDYKSLTYDNSTYRNIVQYYNHKNHNKIIFCTR